MAQVQMEGPKGVLRGQAVRFCSACCRFNPLPGGLCSTCRATQGHRLLRPAPSMRKGAVTKIVVALSLASLLWSAVITESVGAFLALGFYSTVTALIVAEIAARRRRPRPIVQRFVRPGIPVIGVEERPASEGGRAP